MSASGNLEIHSTRRHASHVRSSKHDHGRERSEGVDIASPLLALDAALTLASTRTNNPAVLHYLELAKVQAEEIAALVKTSREPIPGSREAL